jgi:N-methylhydantoinase A/oxoprolinase/acetone carboxylase beta subunit
VFSAFGSSVSDISHLYERALYLASLDDGGLDRIRAVIEEMKAEGVKDLLGEGLKPADATFSIEWEVSQRGHVGVSIVMPESALQSLNAATFQVNAALSNSATGHREAFGIDLVRLQIRKAMPKPNLPRSDAGGADASRALKGARNVSWGSKDGLAQIYRWESLQPGNRVEGCAVLEGANGTYFVPEGWILEMDGYGNAKLRRR